MYFFYFIFFTLLCFPIFLNADCSTHCQDCHQNICTKCQTGYQINNLNLCVPETCDDCQDEDIDSKKSVLFEEFDHDMAEHDEQTNLETIDKKATSDEAKNKNIDVEEENISITDMSWDDIQRLLAAFVFCIIGTLASNGNMVWTLLMFAYLVAMWFWWASDKQEELHNMWAKKYWIVG